MLGLKNKKMRQIFFCRNGKGRGEAVLVILVATLAVVLCNPHISHCMGWPEIKTRLLPDASFAVVEVDVGRKVRHCPHHDSNGKLDEEQLIFCLGTLARVSWLNKKMAAVAQKHLETHYNKIAAKKKKKGIQGSININDVRLTELVTLPQIGPVLAVKIVEYKHTHNLYMSIEDIKKVDGIGHGTYNAIRHYIRVH